MADEQIATAEETKAAPVEAANETGAEAKPVAGETQAEPPRRRSSDTVVDKEGNVIVRKDSYTKDEMAAIVKAAKKNARYATKREIEAFYQGRESATPKPAAEKPAPVVEDKPPTRDQYESYEAFLDAKAEYTGKRAAHEYRTKAEAEQKARAAQEAQAERVKSFQVKVNEKYPDLAERAESIAHIQMPDGMGEAIAESESGPDILNHFAENPKDFERIAALSPSAAIREVGKLEARLEGAAKKPEPVVEKKASAAPAPLKPVGGTAVLGDGEPSHDNPDAWRAWRDRQVAAKKRPAAQVK